MAESCRVQLISRPLSGHSGYAIDLNLAPRPKRKRVSFGNGFASSAATDWRSATFCIPHKGNAQDGVLVSFDQIDTVGAGHAALHADWVVVRQGRFANVCRGWPL